MKISKKFPSPVGELHFSISGGRSCNSIYAIISVPCRGTTFLNESREFDKVEKYHFRPLSGNYISQSCRMVL